MTDQETEDRRGRTIRIRQVRSAIACKQRTGTRCAAWGCAASHHEVERVDTPAVRGMIAKIPHLVEVERGLTYNEDCNESETPQKGRKHAAKRVGRGPGSGHGKTAGRGEKGQKSRSGYSRQARLRRRPDAAAPPAAEARLHQHLPRRVRGGQRRRTSSGLARRRSTTDAPGSTGLARSAGGLRQGARRRRDQGPRARRAPQEAHRVSARQVLEAAAAAAKIEKAGGTCRGDRARREPSVLREHLRNICRDRGPAQAGAVHVRAAGGLPPRLHHPDAGRRSGARCASSSRHRPRAAARLPQHSSPAARSSTCRSSRSASCRTSPRRSSCSC